MLANPEQVVLFLAGVSLRIAVVAAIACGALAVFRVGNPAVRHRVWTVVLLGMLGLPVLVAWAPAWGIPLGSLSWSAPTTGDSSPTDSYAQTLSDVPVSDGSRSVGEADRDGSPLAEQLALTSAAPATEQPTADQRAGSMPTSAAAAPAEVNAIQTIQTAGTPAWWNTVAWTLLTIYAAGVLMLLLRLGGGIVSIQRLLRRAVFVKQVDGVDLLLSEDLAVPITAGSWGPRIIVPATWDTWAAAKQAAVLRHELEHVARRDPLIRLLAAMACCCYWFHPVSWVLARRLSALAEECCDDAVLRETAARTAYARYLLEFAAMASRRGPGQQLIVAMARPAQIATRIQQILDARRSIPTRPRR